MVQYASLSSSHQAFLSHISQYVEPNSYTQAAQDPNWIIAMNKELQPLEANKIWELVPLPQGKKHIDCKWFYKVKLKLDGTLERFKVRLVAKCYNQKGGIDYQETFSPVIKMATVRCILTLAASKGWEIFQLDVNNAFLLGDLIEEVYMKFPEGVPNPNQQVCLLKKSLEGLKQTSKQWFAKLVQELLLQ